MRVLCLFLLLVVLLGCANKQEDIVFPEPLEEKIVVDAVNWNNDLGYAHLYWRDEVRKYLDNPFVLVVHGNDNKEGVWTVFPDEPRSQRPVREVAEEYRAKYPDRDIVLIICNAGGQRLNMSRVYHALQEVNAKPYSHYSDDPDWKHPDGKHIIGRFEDFVTGPVAK